MEGAIDGEPVLGVTHQVPAQPVAQEPIHVAIAETHVVSDRARDQRPDSADRGSPPLGQRCRAQHVDRATAVLRVRHRRPQVPAHQLGDALCEQRAEARVVRGEGLAQLAQAASGEARDEVGAARVIRHGGRYLGSGVPVRIGGSGLQEQLLDISSEIVRLPELITVHPDLPSVQRPRRQGCEVTRASSDHPSRRSSARRPGAAAAGVRGSSAALAGLSRRRPDRWPRRERRRRR